MKEKQFLKLNQDSQKRSVNVIRSGSQANISVFDLLAGDVLYIEQGDILPVDGIIIKSNNVIADESSITGESKPVPKTVLKHFELEDHASPFLVSGSRIIEGSGEMIICCVGTNSQLGQMRLKLQEDDD